MSTTTEELTRTDRIAARRAELAKKLGDRPNVLDLPHTWTTRQVNAHNAETALLDGKIAAFNAIVDQWLALPSLEADQKWFADLTAWRADFSAELMAIKLPIRNEAVRQRALALGWSVELIDRGLSANRLPAPIVDLSATLLGQRMKAAGYEIVGAHLHGPNGFRGSLPETERRIKALTAQRAEVEAALDELLLTDAERAAREIEVEAHRKALANLRITVGVDGLEVVDEDGQLRDLDTLTPEERAAFDSVNAQELSYRQSVRDRQSTRSTTTV